MPLWQTIHMDPYKILGLDRDATPEDVKRSYRRLAIKYHPDRYSGSDKKFIKITEAYNMLSNVDAMKRYNESTEDVSTEYTPDEGFGINIIKRVMKNVKSFVSKLQELDIIRPYAPDVLDVTSGIDTELDIMVDITCKLCDRYHNRLKNIEIFRDTRPSKHLTVGLLDNFIIIKGEGEMEGDRCGNLFINVKVEDDGIYDADNYDLFLSLPIPADDFEKNTIVKFLHFGELVKITHDPHSDSDWVKVSGRGLIRDGDDDSMRGDLHILITRDTE